MNYETVILEKEERLAIVTLNRPERLNAINALMKEELFTIFKELEQDENIWGVILAGGPKAFCAGADIKERSQASKSAKEFYSERLKTHEFFNRIENFEKPLIAAVSGIAVGGGCELALTCDLRIASETARFGLTETKIGAIPSGGGTQRLPRLIGVAKAKELLFTASLINASEAKDFGLVSRVVPEDRLLPETKKLLHDIMSNAPLAVRMAKRAVNVGVQLDLNSALDYEAHCASMLAGSNDRAEGMKAFLEKRPPRYTGS